MERPFSKVLIALIPVLIFAGISIYPAMIYVEWKKETEMLKNMYGEHYLLSPVVLHVPEDYQHIYKWGPEAGWHRYLYRAIALQVDSETCDQTDFDEIAKLKHLRSLGIWPDVRTEEALEKFAVVIRLEYFNHQSMSVLDEELEYLEQCKWLKSVTLLSSNVTDATLVRLLDKPHLEEIQLLTHGTESTRFSKSVLDQFEAKGVEVTLY